METQGSKVTLPAGLLDVLKPQSFVMLSGLPGLGKTSLAHAIKEMLWELREGKVGIVSSDDIWELVAPWGYSPQINQRGYQMMLDLCTAYMEQGAVTIFDSTGLTKKHRNRFHWAAVRARAYGANPVSVWFPPDLELSIERRGSVIDEERLRSFAKSFEEPSSAEPFDFIFEASPV